MRLTYQIPSPKAPILGATVPPVVGLEYLSPPADLRRYADVREVPRFRSAPAPRVHEGASVAPAAQSYVFSVCQPIRRRQIQLPRPRPPIDVAVVAVTQTDVFTLSQPDQARYAARQRNRFLIDAPKRIDDGAAALVPQTYIFPVNQPEFRAWLKVDANRVPSGPTPQLAGATVQQTYVFPLGQPEPRYYVRHTFAETKTPVFGVTVIAPQTYEFAVSQPEARRYNLSDANRYAPTGPVPQTSGATNQATFIFPVGQPEMARFAIAQVARRFGGTVSFPLDTFSTAPALRSTSIVWYGSSSTNVWPGSLL